MKRRPLKLALFLLGASTLAAFAQAPATPKPPIVNDPALKIELVATLPEIEAPTTVCSDPSGAIYVGNDPRDGRLSTDQPVATVTRFDKAGPGRKRTVFADKLYSPAGSAWHDGFLYILHDPFLTRFKDTDGDGVADVREDLVTNLGIPPNAGLNDHVVSGFTLGMDGFFYISVGDRGIYRAKSVRDGSTITMQGGGIVRCRTDGTQLEVFSTGTRNHLQVNLDAEDNAFTRDNTDDGNGWWTRLTHHIEGGYYGYPYDFRGAINYGVVQPSEQTLNAIKQHGGTVQVTPPWSVDKFEHKAVVNPGTGEEKDVSEFKITNKDTGSSVTLSKAQVAEVVGQAHRLPGGAVAGGAPALQSGGDRFLPAMADFGGGSPTGGLCYLSDGLPEQYRGKHFFSEWGKAGIFVTEVARDGATFRFVSDTKLIEPEKGADFRPMQISVAADGSLLIADWGYSGWKSPRVAGAIWRLYWPEAKPAPRLADESKASVEELIAALGHPDRDQRLRAQGALTQKGLTELVGKAPMAWGSGALPKALDAVVRDANSPQLQRMHALWTWAALSAGERQASQGKPFAGNMLTLMDARFQLWARDFGPELRVQALRASALVPHPWMTSSSVEPEKDAAVRLQQALTLCAHGDLRPDFDHFLRDPDAWVRFAALAGLREHLARGFPIVKSANHTTASAILASALRSPDSTTRDAAWLIFPAVSDTLAVRALGTAKSAEHANRLGVEFTELLTPLITDKATATRSRATAALGRIAFQPAPYDGHWWGTQPVKNPRPLNSVPWAGTVPALTALTAALADADAGVRWAAAKAFTQFAMPIPAPATVPGKAAAAPGAAPAALEKTAAAVPRPSRAFSAVSNGFSTPVQRLFHPRPTASFPPSNAFSTPVQRLFGERPSIGQPAKGVGHPSESRWTPLAEALDAPKKASDAAQKVSDAPRGAAGRPEKAVDRPAGAADQARKAASRAQKAVAGAGRGAAVSQKATFLLAAAPAAAPKAAAESAPTAAGLDEAVAAARAALRSRLTVETEPAVRRQLIEAIGVQKDPQAMDVFRQIALDEKADEAFRDTAIGAVVSIGTGGDAAALEAAKKTIAQLAAAQLSAGATRKVVTAVGELKVLDAAPALIALVAPASSSASGAVGQAPRLPGGTVAGGAPALQPDAATREAAVKALQQLGAKSNAGPALVTALSDKDGKVLAAAIEALGSFKEKSALPALIALAEKRRYLKETSGALANMPDATAIPVLVETLRDKNTGVRRNALKALKAMRAEAMPQVEALLASGRVPEELVPEIKNAFESGAITHWKMIGVFENVWDAVHPPEKDALAALSAPVVGQAPRLPADGVAGGAPALQFLGQKYHNAEGKDVGWSDVTGDAEVGRVDLGRVFKTTAMVCAYAFIEIDAPEAAEAKLFTSADDELGVWINGQRVLNLPGSHGYNPDANETLLPLKAGKNALFLKIGNKGGTWVFHARIPGFENGKFIKSKDPTPEEKQKTFALAATPDGTFINAGDAKRGEKLFFDQGAAMGGICATCHAVGAKGGQIGPALTTVGLNYKRADLIVSLHEPSKTIALGYEQVMIETKGGEMIAGSLRAETGEVFTIADAAGQSKDVKKADVKTKTDLHTSLMPPGLTLGLKPEEFADLLAYLESLKG